MGELGEIVRGYYAALNEGDPEAIATFFSEDVVHYYTSLGPTRGARAIAELAVVAHKSIDGRYFIEDLVEGDDQVAVEWTMTWRDPGSSETRLVRGAEFYRFDGERILEVRSYSGGTPKNPFGNLVGFDHAGRGYMTTPGG